jgi:hypothetical protein
MAWLRFQAEILIREQLELGESASLYCYLGEVTEQPEYYEKAWALSGERSGRAQRLLARHYFALGEVTTHSDTFRYSIISR